MGRLLRFFLLFSLSVFACDGLLLSTLDAAAESLEEEELPGCPAGPVPDYPAP